MADQGFSHLRLSRGGQLREEDEAEGQAGSDSSGLQTGARPDAILGGPVTQPMSGETSLCSCCLSASQSERMQFASQKFFSHNSLHIHIPSVCLFPFKI